MKVCKNCGAQNFDIKQNCDKCGYPLVEKGSVSTMQKQMNGSVSVLTKKKASGAAIAAKVFLILTNVAYDILFLFWLVWWIIGLTYSQPVVAFEGLICMLVYLVFAIASGVVLAVYDRKVDLGEKVGTAFKVCTLLFISIIAGILMLCDNGPEDDVQVVVCNQPASPTPTDIKKDDKFDEVKKYKELLENGVITQEEFDAKKKELLGL